MPYEDVTYHTTNVICKKGSQPLSKFRSRLHIADPELWWLFFFRCTYCTLAVIERLLKLDLSTEIPNAFFRSTSEIISSFNRGKCSSNKIAFGTYNQFVLGKNFFNFLVPSSGCHSKLNSPSKDIYFCNLQDKHWKSKNNLLGRESLGTESIWFWTFFRLT